MASSMAIKDSTPPVAMKPSEARKSRQARRANKQMEITSNQACPQCKSNGRDSTGNHMMVFKDGSGLCPKCVPSKKYTAEEVKAAKDGGGLANSNGGRVSRYQKRQYTSGFKPQMTVEDISHLGFLGEKRRGITAETDKHLGIRTETNQSTGTPIARYYPYLSGPDLYGYKNRGLPKSWGSAVGTIQGTDLFGWHLCTGSRRTLVIVEGEEDCAAGFQLWSAMNLRAKSRRVRKSVPHIVSLPNGAKGVKKVIMKHLPEIQLYDRVIWMGDNIKTDKDGAEALEEVVEVLGINKLFVPDYPDGAKDICDILDPDDFEGSIDKFSDMWFCDTIYSPIDIREGSTFTYEEVFKDPVIGLDFPFESLCEQIGGIRLREHTVILAGSGCGKTTLCRAIAHHLGVAHGWRVGNVYLEEQNTKTVQGYIACHSGVSLKSLRKDPDIITQEQKDDAMQMISDNHVFLSHSGSIDTDVLMAKFRYLYNIGCKLIVFDHLSMAVNRSIDQRAALDTVMEEIYSFCDKHDVHIISVIHLSRDNKSLFTRGAEITENHIRGSAGVMQLAWNVIAMEGDTQHPAFKNHRFMRVLKCREIGELGLCDGSYVYSHTTGEFTYDPHVVKEMIFDDDSSAPSTPSMGGGGKRKPKYDSKAA